jgi:amylosucrase
MPSRSQFPTNAASHSYQRLLPALQERFASYASQEPQAWQEFCERLRANFDPLFNTLLQVYGDQYDFYYHLGALLEALAASWMERPVDLKALDRQRLDHPDWFQSNQMVGGVCYVDLFAGDLAGLRTKVPYFQELGLTYLHLMPLFRCPEGENDGGYAISSYREVDPKLGTMAELSELARELRQHGISLVNDFVFNHTSHEHAWAINARAGDPVYQDYYRMYPDRSEPDAYERTLREIFPDEHPGAFTWFPEINRWVWTTFHSYQWDLNYANPEVFIAMTQEMLVLANAGVEVLRLDAVAFIWKKIGTDCENLPEAHLLIQAFNACARIAAPALLFKSEAIVHPDEVARYIRSSECQISYNPLLMALLWESLATRKVDLLTYSLRTRFSIDAGCAWVNYVRCHDDIGWTFSDEDAGKVGIDGFNHRKFLNSFYTGRFPGSFARGLPFQENPKTGDCRISGTCASLAGLEKALREETKKEVDLALARILLIHGIILSIGGIPLIYLGDELAAVNDYAYRADPNKVRDSRWVHRPAMDWQSADWEAAGDRSQPSTPAGRIYHGLKSLIAMRKSNPVFSGHETEIIDTGNSQVLGYLKTHGSQRILALANFSEKDQVIPINLLRLYGLGYQFIDLVCGEAVPWKDLTLSPYQFICLKAAL